MVVIGLYPLKEFQQIISVLPPNPTQQYQTKRYHVCQCFIHFCMMIVNKILKLLLHTVNIYCNYHNIETCYTQPAVLYGIIQMDVMSNLHVQLHFIYCKYCLMYITLYLILVVEHLVMENMLWMVSMIPKKGIYQC